ncbi:MAG: hypothetical protein ACLTDR_00740 [Adlercreutzia equolifaciens]
MSQFLDSHDRPRAKADKKTIVLPEGNEHPHPQAPPRRFSPRASLDLIVSSDAGRHHRCRLQLEGARIVDFRTSEAQRALCREAGRAARRRRACARAPSSWLWTTSCTSA